MYWKPGGKRQKKSHLLPRWVGQFLLARGERRAHSPGMATGAGPGCLQLPSEKILGHPPPSRLIKQARSHLSWAVVWSILLYCEGKGRLGFPPFPIPCQSIKVQVLFILPSKENTMALVTKASLWPCTLRVLTHRPKRPGWCNSHLETEDLLPFKSTPTLPPSSNGARLSPQAVSKCANSMNYLSRIIIFLSQEARYSASLTKSLNITLLFHLDGDQRKAQQLIIMEFYVQMEIHQG